MASNRPRIGIPVDCKMIGTDPSHVVGEKYMAAVAHASQSIPVYLPARAAGHELDSLEAAFSADDQLEGLDGLFLTGSASNMEPWRYGSDAPGVGPFDSQRDANNLALLDAALKRDLPIFAVCRGYQELNVACGGTLHTAVQEVAELSDHRDDGDAPRATRYADVHPLHIAENSWLVDRLGRNEILVNSLHGQGIATLAPTLTAEAHAPDGLVEAVRHADRTFVIGVQWHPEWRYQDNAVSMALFEAFGEAAQAYRRQRLAGGD